MSENHEKLTDAATLESASPVYPDHVARELARIHERLASGPDPFQHAGLYAAQQALCWAAYPRSCASPFEVVTGSASGSGDCSRKPRPPEF